MEDWRGLERIVKGCKGLWRVVEGCGGLCRSGDERQVPPTATSLIKKPSTTFNRPELWTALFCLLVSLPPPPPVTHTGVCTFAYTIPQGMEAEKAKQQLQDELRVKKLQKEVLALREQQESLRVRMRQQQVRKRSRCALPLCRRHIWSSGSQT